MKKYILFMFLVFLSVTHNLSAYCVHNYTDGKISVRDSQSGHGRMGWHDLNTAGESTCCDGYSKGCHPDKHIAHIYIEAKNSNSSFTCNIEALPHGDVYILSDHPGNLYCNTDGALSNCCSSYCCTFAGDCSNPKADCGICQGNCLSCRDAGHCGWKERQKK